MIDLREFTSPVSFLTPGFKPQAIIGWNNALTTGYGFHGDGTQGLGWWAKRPYPDVAADQFVSAGGQLVFFIGHINDAGRFFGEDRYDTFCIGPSDPQGSQTIGKAKCSKVVYSGSNGGEAHGVLFLGGRKMKAKAGIVQFSPGGSLSVTGLGFEPQLLIFHSARSGIGANDGGAFAMGTTDGTNQWSYAWDSPYLVDGDVNPSQMQTGVWRNDLCAVMVTNPSVSTEVEITSLDSDGFTVNVITAGSELWSYLAIADPGGEFAVGEATQDDASITVGFEAEAMLFASGGRDDYTVSVSFASGSLGGASQAAQVGGCTAQRINNADRYWNSSALAMIDTGTLGPSLKAEMVVDGWNPTTVDLDWTTTDSLGRLFGWIAFKTDGKKPCGHPLPRLNAGR